MKVLFIHSIYDINTPVKPLRSFEEMQFGISYISSVLRSNGHLTKLVILSRLFGKENIDITDAKIRQFKPGVICFTSVSSEYPFISGIARHIKQFFPDIKLIIGGAHASLNPDAVMKDDFDVLCIGEGEYAILEFVTALEKKEDFSNIENLWIKAGQGIKKNRVRPFIADLDALPFPDTDMWKEMISDEYNAAFPILLGRGCPFECTYCCNHAIKKLATGAYVRFRVPEKIVDEIESIARKTPDITDFYLEVETIGANKTWALDLCSKLKGLNAKRATKLSFGTNLRVTPNLACDALFKAFKEANFKFVNIGLESGNERVRRDILNRNYSNDDIRKTVKSAKAHGININFYNLIGIPGESKEDFNDTIKMNRECLPDNTLSHIFFPYPGTKLYEFCSEKGLLSDIPDTELERCKATLDLPGFSRKDIQKSFVWFDYNVYKGKRPLSGILVKVIAAKLRSNAKLHRIYRKLTYSRPYRFFKRILNKR